jgi:hypothetical protein
LDHPEIIKPDINIYMGSKLPWVEEHRGIPAHDEFYQVPEGWPKESQERFRDTMKAYTENS